MDLQVEGDLLVRLDPLLTSAALAHVLENAAQYTPPQSMIAVRASVSPEGLSITVTDRGPGVAAKDLPHLFDRFYRGAQARRRDGTGMGLAIARGMLAAERGRIWAENVRGGAQFTIAVPAESRVASEVEQPS